MALLLPADASPSVLITHPGPRIAETVHALFGQGARVEVAPEPPADGAGPEVAATLADLVGRQLIRLTVEPSGTAYDVVVRDPLVAAQGVPGGASPGDPLDGESNGVGRVILVGGGPGDPGLLTVAGLAAVQTADVIVCDRLAPLAALAQARPDAEIIHVGKIPRGDFTPQESINDLLVDRARAGATVVRFKGGDSFVFGRGGEEWNACVAARVPVEVIPGVSSAVAVPALAAIPLTHRQVSPGFVVVSGHVGPSHPSNAVDWATLAGCGLTLVLLMGIAALPEITAALIEAGLDPETPAACIADGAMPSQRQVVATVATIADAALEGGLAPPAITVIGAVVGVLDPVLDAPAGARAGIVTD